MHRQHPYAGYGPPPGARRTDSPPSVGPDRTRGGGGSFNARGRPNAAPPLRRGGAPPPHAGHGYESPPYGLPQMDNPYAEDSYNFRNGNGGEFNDYESSLDGKRGRQGARREPDDKVHDSLIEERLQRERPCRTLFIRNIKYETDSNEFRHKFEEFGEIKTFFDLISHRGMVFCTYFDMRAAERAKERLQGTELAGRPIDVHYSLPREDQKNEANQGIIIVSLIDSPTRAAIDDLELRRKLTVFGDVKTITPNNGRHDSRQVEFYDLRSAEEAHGKLRHQPLQDGILETEFVYLGEAPPPGPAMQERARQERGTRGRNRGGRGGRGGRAGGGGGGGYDGRGRDWEEEDNYGRDRGRMSPARYEERWRERSPPPRGRSNGDLGADREKLEQAKKVQDLLAALKSTGAASSLPPAGSSGPPPQPMYGYPPPPNAGGGPPPPFQLPPNMAHLGALLQQAASLPPQQAQAVTNALSQYQQPYQTQQYPPPPPQSAMYPGSQPPPSSQPPYGYPPPPGGGNGPPPSAYGGHDIYSLLGQKQGSQSGPPPSALPPDAARYNYNSPPSQGQSSQGAAASGSQPHSIQDIMALLKRSSQS